jgi:hypothetical protein
MSSYPSALILGGYIPYTHTCIYTYICISALYVRVSINVCVCICTSHKHASYTVIQTSDYQNRQSGHATDRSRFKEDIFQILSEVMPLRQRNAVLNIICDDL